jgi:DNA-binding transcriptional MerR regulator
MYTIKEAAARTGVSVPLLRAWERRYRIVEPTRTVAGYRLYDEDALRRLRDMRRLIDMGWAPQVAAAALLAGTAPSARVGLAPEPGGTAPALADDDARRAVAARSEELHEAFVAAAGRFDGPALERALDEMFARGTFETAVERDVLPALVALGDAWATGRIDVAAEHAASAAVHRRLASAFQAAGAPAAPEGAILVGLPPGAHHELGALAFAVAARRAGLHVLYLGSDLPVDDWVRTARRLEAPVAVLGVVSRLDRDAASRVARALVDAVPGIRVAFGGDGADGLDERLDGGATVRVLPAGIRDAVAAVAADL